MGKSGSGWRHAYVSRGIIMAEWAAHQPRKFYIRFWMKYGNYKHDVSFFISDRLMMDVWLTSKRMKAQFSWIVIHRMNLLISLGTRCSSDSYMSKGPAMSDHLNSTGHSKRVMHKLGRIRPTSLTQYREWAPFVVERSLSKDNPLWR